MNRRNFLGLFGFSPLLSKVEIDQLKLPLGEWGEVRDVTNFLIPSKIDGELVYEVNLYGEFHKLVVLYLIKNLIDIQKSQHLGFESKEIFDHTPTQKERDNFLIKCKLNLDRSKLRLINVVPDRIKV